MSKNTYSHIPDPERTDDVFLGHGGLLITNLPVMGPDNCVLFGLHGHSRIHKIPFMPAEKGTQIVACSASAMMLPASEQEVFRTCARQFDD